VGRKTGPALGLALLAAVVVSYLPVRNAGFVWNDHTYVTENPTLDGLPGLARIWTEPTSNEQYYPLVFTTYWFEKRLWGLHPLGYHVVNVLLHAGAALLLWRFLRRLGLPGAWLAAAAFALHPVCVESVAWVTERKNTLSLVLVLLSAHAWLSWRAAAEARDAAAEVGKERKKRKPAAPVPLLRRPGALWAASLGLLTLALFAKTTASVLPAVLLVVVWRQRGRIRRADVRPLVPFFAVGVALALHTAWLEKTVVKAAGDEWAHGLADRVVLAGQTTAFYAGKILYPVDLAFIYRRWTVDASEAVQWIPAAAWAAALAGAWAASRRGRRGPLASLLLFGGVLFPAMGFFDVYAMRYSWVADHFAYQAVAVGAASVVCGAASALGPLRPERQRAAAAAGVALLLVLGTLSYRQTFPYESRESLWLHTIALNPECFICHTNLGNELLVSGRTAEAVAHLERSLEIKPDAIPTLLNLARVEDERGQPGKAAERLRAALALDPSDTEIRVHLGTVYAQAGRLEDAIREFREALRTPSDVDFLAHNGLGVALVRSGRVEEGIGHLRECVRLRPDYERGRANLETVLARVGAR